MRRTLLLGIHWLIILHLLAEIAYTGYMVFEVLRPESGGGALFSRAQDIPFELMVTRRLYAIECWIATVGLAIYLALTEVGPRLKRARQVNRAED